jgi:hypothetical protein
LWEWVSLPGDFDGDGDVDLVDFPVLASAWRTEPGDPNWNPDCDISDLDDDFIDELDLGVYADYYLVGVILPPSMLTHPADQNVCSGNTAEFTVAAVGQSLSYQWQKDGLALSEGGHYSGVTSDTLTISNADSNDAADYRCAVSNPGGSAVSDSATLTILEVPLMTQQPQSQSVLLGETVVLTVTATGSSLTYQWQKDSNDLVNGGNISGADTAVLEINDVNTGDEGEYRCVVGGDYCTVTSEAAMLTVIIGTKFGGRADFNGTNAYLTLPEHDDWYFGSGDFTVDFWVAFNKTSDSQRLFIQYEGAYGLFDIVYEGNHVGFHAYNLAGGVVAGYITGTWIPSIRSWHHIAVVRNGADIYIFIDGVSQSLTVGTAIGSTSLENLSGNPIIGKWKTSIDYLDGYLDEFRISKGIARWTANFTPPSSAYSSDSYTKLLLHCDGNADDDGHTGHTLTNNNVTFTP